MKRILAAFFLTAAALCAQSETLDLGANGKLTFFLLGDWKVDSTDIGNNPTLIIKPNKPGVNAECTISVTFPETDRLDRKDRLKLQVEAEQRNAAEESVEGKAVAREFALNVPGAFGFYCTFTDPKLRGKPPVKGDFKNGTFGKIRLPKGIIIDIALMADGVSSEPYQQLLGAIEGMEFTPGRGR